MFEGYEIIGIMNDQIVLKKVDLYYLLASDEYGFLDICQVNSKNFADECFNGNKKNIEHNINKMTGEEDSYDNESQEVLLLFQNINSLEKQEELALILEVIKRRIKLGEKTLISFENNDNTIDSVKDFADHFNYQIRFQGNEYIILSK